MLHMYQRCSRSGWSGLGAGCCVAAAPRAATLERALSLCLSSEKLLAEFRACEIQLTIRVAKAESPILRACSQPLSSRGAVSTQPSLRVAAVSETACFESYIYMSKKHRLARYSRAKVSLWLQVLPWLEATLRVSILFILVREAKTPCMTKTIIKRMQQVSTRCTNPAVWIEGESI